MSVHPIVRAIIPQDSAFAACRVIGQSSTGGVAGVPVYTGSDWKHAIYTACAIARELRVPVHVLADPHGRALAVDADALEPMADGGRKEFWSRVWRSGEARRGSDQLELVRDWAEARLANTLGDPSPAAHHRAAIAAADLLRAYLDAEPLGDGDTREVHIYG